MAQVPRICMFSVSYPGPDARIDIAKPDGSCAPLVAEAAQTIAERAASLLIVFHRNILAGVVGHESSGYRADDGAGGDKNGDRVAGVISSEQRSRDNRRRPAGDDRR